MWSSKTAHPGGMAMKTTFYVLAACLFMISLAGAADNVFDESRVLLCASREAIVCAPAEACEKGTPEEIGAPSFLTVNFAAKEIVGPKRASTIAHLEKNDEQITLYGFEVGMGWTIVISRKTGLMTATLAGQEEAFVIFAACTGSR